MNRSALAVLAFLLPAQASAATYFVDASVGGSAIYAAVGNVSGIAQGGFETALFTFPSGQYHAGDVIDFGSVTLYPSPIFCTQYATCDFLGFYFARNALPNLFALEPDFSVGDACSVAAPAQTCSTRLQSERAAVAPRIVDLLFVLGGDTSQIQ